MLEGLFEFRFLTNKSIPSEGFFEKSVLGLDFEEKQNTENDPSSIVFLKIAGVLRHRNPRPHIHDLRLEIGLSSRVRSQGNP